MPADLDLPSLDVATLWGAIESAAAQAGIALYVARIEAPPRMLRRLGAFDLHPDPTTAELDTVLLKGETIRPDASRLFRSRPPNWRNPLAEKDGIPGVVYRWLDVEGPLLDAWPPAGHRLLFGDLPIKDAADGPVEIAPGDVDTLLRGFLAKAYRRPAAEADVARFRDVVKRARAAGLSFQDAMIAGYSAALCSPGFVCLEEKPGRLVKHGARGGEV